MSKEDRIYIHGHLLYILQTISDWCSMSSQYPNGNGFSVIEEATTGILLPFSQPYGFD
jgi:hypothetical protein